MTNSILVDCDPGIDDALALAMVIRSTQVVVHGVTTVAGNLPLQVVTDNALALTERFEAAELPVSAGVDRPLVRPLSTAAEIHGQNGLGSQSLAPPTATPTDAHAIDRIGSLVCEGPVNTILALAPLTNLAIALRRYPSLPQHLDRIVLMGGAINDGNVSPVAEFNIATDPEAAQIVFDAPVDITMVGLDVTRTARIGSETIDTIRAVDFPGTSILAGMLEDLQDVHRERDGWDRIPLHDPLAAAALLDPTVIETQPMAVEVERAGTATTGMTVCDRRPGSGREPNAAVATGVDVDRFIEILLETLRGKDSRTD